MKSDIIYKTFIEEYMTSSYIGWDRFIKSKDLGLTVTNLAVEKFSKCNYIVVDEKKWLLAKLKYGF
jgi:hypothetical protein